MLDPQEVLDAQRRDNTPHGDLISPVSQGQQWPEGAAPGSRGPGGAAPTPVLAPGSGGRPGPSGGPSDGSRLGCPGPPSSLSHLSLQTQTQFRQEEKGRSGRRKRANLPAPGRDEGTIHSVLQSWFWFRKGAQHGPGTAVAKALKVPRVEP